jgi:hypothetical protein
VSGMHSSAGWSAHGRQVCFRQKKDHPFLTVHSMVQTPVEGCLEWEGSQQITDTQLLFLVNHRHRSLQKINGKLGEPEFGHVGRKSGK